MAKWSTERDKETKGLALGMGRKRQRTAKALDDLAALSGIVESKEFKVTR